MNTQETKILELTNIRPFKPRNLSAHLTPPHKNILWIFTIFLQTLTNIFIKYKWKIWITIRTKLRRIAQPPKETYICLQEWRRLVINLTKVSHVEDKRGFIPTRRSMHLSWRDSWWQWRKSQAKSRNAGPEFNQIRKLLEKVTRRPDGSYKTCRTTLMVHKFWREAYAKIIISTTYWRRETTKFEGPTQRPKKSCWSTTLENRPPSPSANKIKKGIGAHDIIALIPFGC